MAVDAENAENFEALKQRLADYFKNGDSAALATLYSEDAILLPPGAPAIAGREDIEAFWQRLRQVQQLDFNSESLKPLGASAMREIGVMRMVVGPGAEQAREVHNKYVFVWEKIGGEWKLETCIWNRIAEAQPGGRQPIGGGGGGGMRGRRRPGFVPREN